ncbi:DUF4350 domain-containing protein [Oscillatoria sp. CS-180]|uniref:DUF4350 domain-containing protein n=1 Tax=Oscillatoria sp. CS-180 TaxID=3021720 RepID=UPI00232DDD76|nr:DUF4350 domain-containing protein [Oscillatoria sp. CS-180]MDB9528888.1 DUF4350 domain-containing protein [Oscillatoria sp. CS-180]
MNGSLSFSNRYIRFGLVAVVLLFLAILVLAPATGQKTSGSTYNRAPQGYLGWYAYMEAEGKPIKRWRRPLTDLLEQPASEEPQTLLQVYSGMVSTYRAWDGEWLSDWLAAGNRFVALGINTWIEDVPFTTSQVSPFGDVIVKTRRRERLPINSDRNLLGDEFGAIVWQEERNGNAAQLYVAATPHLAANAYRYAPGNYDFLADLVTQAGGTIWVDEYIHGYKDADVVVEEVVNSWGAYLAETPIKIALIQIAILLSIFLLAQNRRLGNLTPVREPKVDNSQAYIDALAAVLHKAESTSFLVDMITKAERSRLLQALGFNKTGVEDAALQAAWTQQTGQPAEAIAPLLKSTQQPQLTESALNTWLETLRQIRQTPIQ